MEWATNPAFSQMGRLPNCKKKAGFLFFCPVHRFSPPGFSEILFDLSTGFQLFQALVETLDHRSGFSDAVLCQKPGFFPPSSRATPGFLIHLNLSRLSAGQKCLPHLLIGFLQISDKPGGVKKRFGEAIFMKLSPDGLQLLWMGCPSHGKIFICIGGVGYQLGQSDGRQDA